MVGDLVGGTVGANVGDLVGAKVGVAVVGCGEGACENVGAMVGGGAFALVASTIEKK